MIRWFRKRNAPKVFITGLLSSGKKALCRSLNDGRLVKEGYLAGYFENHGFEFYCVEPVARKTMLEYYLSDSVALLYVVDSSDVETLEKSKELFYDIINRECLGSLARILVVACKQDAMHAIAPMEIMEVFQLNQITNREWNIQGCSCKQSPEKGGIHNIVAWLLR